MRTTLFRLWLAFALVLYASSAAYADGLLQGLKQDAAHNPFVSPLYPGATLSVRVPSHTPGVLQPLSDYKATFGAASAEYSTSLAAGQYEVGMQVPDGYQVFYSLCNNCIDHPEGSFQPYGALNEPPLIVTITDGQYVDLHWRFIATGFVQLPVPPLPGSFQNLSENETRFDLQNLSETLTCNVPGVPNPIPATNEQLFDGADTAWASVGINAPLGAIGVSLNLINPAHPNMPLQIIDARSAGGAAWQSTLGLVDPQMENGTHPISHFNQAAGNSAANWGFGSEMAIGPTIGMVQRHFVPLFANDVETAIGSGVDALFTPCYHSGQRFGNGHMSLQPSYPVVASQKILRLTSTYTFRALGTQNRGPGTSDEQALYFLRSASRAANLRVYFLGADDKTLLGPIFPTQSFPTPYPGFTKSQVLVLNCPTTPGAGCFIRTLPTAFALLIWNVAGQDIAMAIHGSNQLGQEPAVTHFGGVLYLRQIGLCQNPNEDACGGVQWHSVFTLPSDGSFSNGEEVIQTLNYDIGTVSQIRALLAKDFPSAELALPSPQSSASPGPLAH